MKILHEEDGLSRHEIAGIFTEKIVFSFIPQIDSLFKEGYDLNEIAVKSGLRGLIQSSSIQVRAEYLNEKLEEMIYRALTYLYFDFYESGMGFGRFRK